MTVKHLHANLDSSCTSKADEPEGVLSRMAGGGDGKRVSGIAGVAV